MIEHPGTSFYVWLHQWWCFCEFSIEKQLYARYNIKKRKRGAFMNRMENRMQYFEEVEKVKPQVYGYWELLGKKALWNWWGVATVNREKQQKEEKVIYPTIT